MATNPIPEEVPFDGLEDTIAHDSLNPEELAIAAQQQERLFAILGQHISPRQLAVIEAIYVDGGSVDDVALRLGLQSKQVINARHSALKKLRTVKGLQALLGGK